jgi:hypothetical protein
VLIQIFEGQFQYLDIDPSYYVHKLQAISGGTGFLEACVKNFRGEFLSQNLRKKLRILFFLRNNFIL